MVAAAADEIRSQSDDPKPTVDRAAPKEKEFAVVSGRTFNGLGALIEAGNLVLAE